MKSSQSMSSKILFENIDKTVDYGGYPNRFPVHLKNMAVSGLPADEVPIIEIRDIHGQVYNSNHADSEVPTWSIEFGDGSFQVSNDILGDFVISCRFGGKHAAIKDSSTVIFTYQNNTGLNYWEYMIYFLDFTANATNTATATATAVLSAAICICVVCMCIYEFSRLCLLLLL